MIERLEKGAAKRKGWRKCRFNSEKEMERDWETTVHSPVACLLFITVTVLSIKIFLNSRIPYLMMYSLCYCSLFRFLVVSDSLRSHGLQHASLLCPSLCPEAYSNSVESMMPPNRLVLCHPLLLLPSIFPSIRVFSNELALKSGGQNIGASASVLPVNIQGWFPLGLTGFWCLCSPRDSQESSPAPQFESINS